MRERILICGARGWKSISVIRRVLDQYPSVICVIEGEAPGADKIGRMVAEELGIPVLSFPADWARFGRAAGPIRNQRMLDEGKPTLVLAFHNNIVESKGTKDMVKRARKAGIRVRLFREA